MTAMLEKSKSGQTPTREKIKTPKELHFDATLNVVAGAFKGVTADHIKKGAQTINARRARIASIYLLTDPVLGLATEDEVGMLLNASAREMEDAIDEVDRAVEKGTELGKFIQTLRATLEGHRPTTTEEKPADNLSQEERLVELARVHFTPEPGTERSPAQASPKKLARWAIILIAEKSLGKDREGAAALANVVKGSVTMMEKEGRHEYAAEGTFYEKVRRICKEIGVPSPPLE